jgi:pyridoxine 5-phosphate synthase
MKPTPKLHVNVDHVATLREARKITEPDPILWALAAEAAGADGITCHLRQDRRHIGDADVLLLRQRIKSLFNLECSLNAEMVALALDSAADEICLVPENRAEVTTEGGLDLLKSHERLALVIPRFQERKMLVSLFIDPNIDQVEAAAGLKADFIELHTGAYSNALGAEREHELELLTQSAERAHKLGLRVNAGHGLNYDNLGPVARLPHLEELNIGHAIVGRAVFAGVDAAIQEMKQLIAAAVAAH